MNKILPWEEIPGRLDDIFNKGLLRLGRDTPPQSKVKNAISFRYSANSFLGLEHLSFSSFIVLASVVGRSANILGFLSKKGIPDHLLQRLDKTPLPGTWWDYYLALFPSDSDDEAKLREQFMKEILNELSQYDLVPGNDGKQDNRQLVNQRDNPLVGGTLSTTTDTKDSVQHPPTVAQPPTRPYLPSIASMQLLVQPPTAQPLTGVQPQSPAVKMEFPIHLPPIGMQLPSISTNLQYSSTRSQCPSTNVHLPSTSATNAHLSPTNTQFSADIYLPSASMQLSQPPAGAQPQPPPTDMQDPADKQHSAARCRKRPTGDPSTSTSGPADPQSPLKQVKLDNASSPRHVTYLLTSANAISMKRVFPNSDRSRTFEEDCCWSPNARMYCFSDESFEVEVDLDPSSDIFEACCMARETFPGLKVFGRSRNLILLSSQGSVSQWCPTDMAHVLF
ncbi:hypothetical protein B0T25DRAFT_60644 [Lasiosphaeria hispida]|uniref:Uncharacterized protein n=1 Tax=Lasiosphaeria hispida TaxID=260671 RepID=A0AAJ0ML52_9PEZI|nr:hypothetical protein B0T25DRAFT_60644 [Lasiosphaeria hispida]